LQSIIGYPRHTGARRRQTYRFNDSLARSLPAQRQMKKRAETDTDTIYRENFVVTRTHGAASRSVANSRYARQANARTSSPHHC
jgi:hypothetical protein